MAKKIYTSDNYIVVDLDNGTGLNLFSTTHSEYDETVDSLILRKYPDKAVQEFPFSDIGNGMMKLEQ